MGKYRSDKGVYKQPEISRRKQPDFLVKANDWRLVFDTDNGTRQFPQMINTAIRPDVVLYWKLSGESSS